MTDVMILVDADGARCLWTDKIDLRDLGHLKVTRVSSVEFNEAGQVWEARHLKTGTLMARHPSREWVLEAEARWLLAHRGFPEV